MGGFRGILGLLLWRLRQAKTWTHEGPYDIPGVMLHAAGPAAGSAAMCSIAGAEASLVHVGGAVEAEAIQIDG